MANQDVIYVASKGLFKISLKQSPVLPCGDLLVPSLTSGEYGKEN